MKPLLFSIFVSLAIAGCSANAVPLHTPYAGYFKPTPVVNGCNLPGGTCRPPALSLPAVDSSARNLNAAPILYRSIFMQGL